MVVTPTGGSPVLPFKASENVIDKIKEITDHQLPKDFLFQGVWNSVFFLSSPSTSVTPTGETRSKKER